MKLERATVDIRPRRTFEILDLAIRFYRVHLIRLMRVAMLFSLPALVLGYAAFFLWGSVFFGGLVFWLMMPLSSHAVMLVASRLVFGNAIEFRESLSVYRPVWLKLFLGRLFQRLLWVPLLPFFAGEFIRLGYVFSPMIVLLERLVGLPGALRRRSLNREGGHRAFGFDCAVNFVALVLALALAFVVDLLGSDILDIWAFGGMFEGVETNDTKFILWVGIAIAVSPVVDLAWFFFYLDTRIRKEGWDLELGFKTVAKHLKRRTEDAA